MKKRRSKKSSRKKFIIVTLFLLTAGLLYIMVDSMFKPVLIEVAEIKVREMVAYAVNEAVLEKLEEDFQDGEFLDIEVDGSGKVSMINANSVYMNQFAAELTEFVHDKIMALESERVMVPLGSIFGSEIMSQIGPEISVKVRSIGAAKVNFYTEFESSGINQTKYKVYIEAISRVKPIIPFSTEEMELSNSVLIAETIVVGDVPKTYVNLPGGEGASGIVNGIRLADLE